MFRDGIDHEEELALVSMITIDRWLEMERFTALDEEDACYSHAQAFTSTSDRGTPYVESQ
ncbi:hypothetical protein GCM10027033_26510 [Leucobacter ruminantium]